MLSVYKGLLLFILLANVFALPIKRSSSDGKVVVFETIKTLLTCTCYYEQGETLDNGKIDEYCDCVPEKVESDKSLIDEDNIEKINGKYVQKSTEDSNLPDAEPIEEDISAAIDDEIVEDIPEYDGTEDVISNVDGKYIVSTVDDNDENDDSGVIRDSEDLIDADGNPIHIDIEMFNDEKEDTGFFENTRYIYANKNLDEEEFEEVGEAYAEEVNDDEEGENQGFFENTRYIYNNNLGDDDLLLDANEEIIGEAYAEEINDDGSVSSNNFIQNNNSKFLVNNNLGDDDLLLDANEEIIGEAYAEEVNDDDDSVNSNDFIKNTSSKFLVNNDVDANEELIGEAYAEEVDNDDEVDQDFIPSRPTISRAMKSVDDNNDHRRILEELDEPMDDADSKFVIDYYNENNEQNDENDDENNEKDILDNVDLINGDDELKELYKKLIIKKLKSDIKKMDSEKLIVDILKEAIQKNPESASNVNESLKNLLK